MLAPNALFENKKQSDASCLPERLYEKLRGIYTLLKLLHSEKAFAINCPALKKNNNKNKEINKKKLVY